ncbi:ABC transporter permease [Paenibacillus eucommiae]|uniref:Aldouronate transport system permease protein n=1 Tax=Paenibacillus eucommiae TaxID=1355755 RepID=A0ABS4J693_9BACL|nr:ABC transporter permease subunit [Paenibacillus eucommiae]MBP1995359.1 putative aldouronate transport system permease protein [Paenibacillus eucommiae]
MSSWLNQAAFKSFKKYKVLYLMILPGILYLLINNYIPMFGIIIAFKDIDFSKGLLGGDWIGFRNFEYLFKTAEAYVITRNTILYNVAFIVLNLIFSVAMAILLNELKNRFLSRFYQSVILLPYLISSVIIGYLVFSLLSMETGFINKSILPLLGLPEIMWYTEPKFWPYILTIVKIWSGVGYLCIIYFAAVVGIDHEYYEAATIDGAGKIQQIWHITIPSIIPIIVIMTLLQIGRIFYADFGLFYQVPLDSGPLQPTTNVLDTYVYRALLKNGDIGMASAAGLYQSVVGFGLILISNYIVKKRNPDNALF